jgi:hypothetical protein
MFLLAAGSGFGEEQKAKKDVDEIMSVQIKQIDLALSNSQKTGTSEGLDEIERLNQDAGASLFDWWDSVTALCCIVVKGKDPKVAWKEAVEKNEPKLTHYLKYLCSNEAKIAGYYVRAHNKEKAKVLYSSILDSFDPSKFGTCVRGAEASLAVLNK